MIISTQGLPANLGSFLKETQGMIGAKVKPVPLG